VATDGKEAAQGGGGDNVGTGLLEKERQHDFRPVLTGYFLCIGVRLDLVRCEVLGVRIPVVFSLCKATLRDTPRADSTASL
jgi:hypothetical protein